MKNKKIPPCPECGEHFDNIFEATDHLLEDNEPEFDPALILPGGYKLMVGSLLRCIYRYAYEPQQIEEIVQSTYMTLYSAEHSPDTISEVVEDMIVDSSMQGLEDELEQLLKGGA